ncbi:hypothetical protein [Micromonospora rubida]|uniref:hypothetical protein n=1 Tax=Micromonospora rubida TaxID=2697657 RepID=UPI001F264668|nr:hypothetical protein [Micromonospora rubida]
MTTAPKVLLAVRTLLLDHLGPHGLEPAAVGIVGDPAHRGGYHCGEDRVIRRSGRIDDYSVVESTRDRAGLTLDASALDVGQFSVRAAGRTHDLRTFSTWCVAQCDDGAPDTLDIREIIYSPDGRTVRRWDRLGRRSSGDSSHLWHTHFSFFRDAIRAGRAQTPLFRRYLTTIGLLEDPDVSAADVFTHPIPNDVTGKKVAFETYVRSFNNSLSRLEATTREALRTSQAALAAAQGVDLGGIETLIRETSAADAVRDQALAELIRQGQSGELAVDELLRRLGEVLTTGTAPAQG